MAETMRKVEKGCRKLEEDAPPTLTAPIKVKVAELDQLFKDLREMCRLVTAFQDIFSKYLLKGTVTVAFSFRDNTLNVFFVI